MADEEAEFDILAEEGETPDEHDVEILETLEEHGEDLSEPREIRVDLLFPDEDSANAAEEELTELGYEVATFEAAGGRSSGRCARRASCGSTTATSPASATASRSSPRATTASSTAGRPRRTSTAAPAPVPFGAACRSGLTSSFFSSPLGGNSAWRPRSRKPSEKRSEQAN